MRERATTSVRRLKTLWIARIGGTDKRRWRQDESFHGGWSSRHELMVSRVRPGDTVLDLGAGPRALEKWLPAGCTYIPVDVVQRGPGSVLCDLNRDALPAIEHDVAVMSGVLEYIHDVPRLFARTAANASRGVASYALLEQMPSIPERLGHGWVNHYTETDMRAMFEEAGWEVVDVDDWAGQRVFHLAVKATHG